MRKRRIAYWMFTVLLGAFLLMGALPDIGETAGAVAIMEHLGYPVYLLPFIGIAKVLGILALLVGGFPRLKEWAYAGLTFDMTGALYSHLSVGDPASVWLFAVVGLLLTAASYLLYRSVRSAESDAYARPFTRGRTGGAARTAASW